MTEPHFSKRLRERAGVTDPDAVYRDLRIALADPDRYPDFIEFVMKASDGKDVWRVCLRDRRFYIIAVGTFPVTVYDQKQIRSKKHKARMIRRGLARKTA